MLRREHGKTGVHRSRVTWRPPSDGSAQIWTDLLASEIRECRGPRGPGLRSTARLTCQLELEGGRDCYRVSGWEGEGQPPRARQLGLTDGAFRISPGEIRVSTTLTESPQTILRSPPPCNRFLASLLHNVVVTPENGQGRTVILLQTGRCTRDCAASLRKRSDAAARVGVPPERPRGRPGSRRDVAAPQPVGWSCCRSSWEVAAHAASGGSGWCRSWDAGRPPLEGVSGACQARQPHASAGCSTGSASAGDALPGAWAGDHAGDIHRQRERGLCSGRSIAHGKNWLRVFASEKLCIGVV